ncbi:ATP-binding protein [Tissierella sp. Yu-01]|uniref:ATP-binding protein n=1 Tax=Tissierella sp. Yu-01 TaxID=3035694 RepID=UPI00240E51EB|nr:ATP-binding protein [Tissierella sp. Yu-01]WFA08593.1 ATP-binding protein [Tissierella sp. Yu-01]
MNSNERKILGIVCELISNSLKADSSDISASINRDEEKFVITVKDNGKGMNEKTLKEVRRILNQPLKEVYEEYYSGLAGNCYSDSGLNIIGFQVDKAEVESSPEGTKITVIRKI